MKAFTLLELLVVVGIMGMLGVAATSGYSALQRGMTERGAVSIASSVLRSAQERAHVDRAPTCVFCYNRLLKAPTGQDDNGVAVGCMVAVRRSGRLTYVRNNILHDEFGDLNATYNAVDSENDAKKGGSFRLFKFNGSPSKMEYAIVSDQVVAGTEAELDVVLFSGAEQTKVSSSAFCQVETGTASNWKVGDGYGFAFVEMQLPEGFIFGQKVPTDPSTIQELTPIVFGEDSDATETVKIWATRPDASGYPKAAREVGEASSDSKKAV